MKQGDCFMVFDSHGDIGASPGGPDGLFSCDTRYLSHFELLINGLQPLLLGSNLSDDNGVLTVDLTNPDIYYDKRIILQKDLLHVARTVFIWRSTLFHRFAVRNFGTERVRLLLSITFDNDFADIFEVRGTRRDRRGTARSRIEHDRAEFVYLGLDGKTPPHQHRVRADADPSVAVARFLSARSRSPRVGFALQHGFLRRRRARAAAVPEEPALHAPRAQADDPSRHRDRHLKSGVQRGAAPGDRRSRDAADPYSRRALPLRGHSLVFDDVRPRRPHHGIAVPVARSAHRARRAHDGSRPIRRPITIPNPTPSPARSCTRCAPARWRRCARFRSGFITAASIRRRCSSCWRAAMRSRPAISTPCAACGRRSTARWRGSTAPAIATRTASSNTSRRRRAG